MRRKSSIWLAAWIFSSMFIVGFNSRAEDIQPNRANGTVVPYGPETGGQPIALVGDSSRTYLVTFNAGVWRSIRNGPWVQIPNSPPRAYSIAVDPNDSSHLAVGERDGDAVAINQNGSAGWESYDGGDNWTKVWDPLTSPFCSSQAIPAIAFSNTSTLIAAGPCGLTLRRSGASTPDFPSLP